MKKLIGIYIVLCSLGFAATSVVNVSAAEANKPIFNTTGVYSLLKPKPVVKRPTTLIKRRLCIWDIMGKNGETVNALKDYKVMSEREGVQFDVHSYTDEKVAIEDFRVGYCDAVVVTGLRARPYNSFTGSVEAVLGLPDAKHMRMLISILSEPKLANLMVTKFPEATYEVAGVMPFGSAYAFVNDKNIKTLASVKGKKIAIFDYDKAQGIIVNELGAKADPSDVTNFAGKFNNGQVDIVLAPLMAYSALELHKGMGKTGGVVDFVFAQVSLQLLIRPDRFPTGFGQKSRIFMDESFDQFQKIIEAYNAQVDDKFWVEPDGEDMRRSNDIGRAERIKLANAGIYDRKMLSLMKRIRCQIDRVRAECAMSDE